MEIRNLRCFLAVAETESFTLAAKKMHMSQSNLSHHIKELQLRVGVPVFERLGRKVRLTTAGAILRDHASRAIRMLDDAIPGPGRRKDAGGPTATWGTWTRGS